MAALRENGMAAGYVFLGVGGVHFVVGFVAFGGDGEKADAVNGAGGRAELGHRHAKLVPGKVDEIAKNAESDDGEEKATNGKRAGGGRCGCA
jgi:hypothetical protein